jgi:hypothetical protein
MYIVQTLPGGSEAVPPIGGLVEKESRDASAHALGPGGVQNPLDAHQQRALASSQKLAPGSSGVLYAIAAKAVVGGLSRAFDIRGL